METYVILRRGGWRTGADLEAAAARSIAEGEWMAGDIRWIRSYVTGEPDGSVGTVCIYQASDPESIKKHAARVGMPAAEILPITDTVVIRADPEKAAA